MSLPTPDATIVGDTLGSGLGVSVAVGDLNNDGFNDLAILGIDVVLPSPQRYDYVNIYWEYSPGLHTTVFEYSKSGLHRIQRKVGLTCVHQLETPDTWPNA